MKYAEREIVGEHGDSLKPRVQGISRTGAERGFGVVAGTAARTCARANQAWDSSDPWIIGQKFPPLRF